MKFREWLRTVFEGPVHISDGDDDAAEAAEDLGEEMPDAQQDVDSLKRAQEAAGDPRVVEALPEPDIGSFENAEHQHDQTEAGPTPPDVKP